MSTSSSAGDNSGLAEVVIALYVDDLLVAGAKPAISAFKTAISQRFSMKDLGALSYLLGMSVARDRVAGTITISQELYTEQILQRFGMYTMQASGGACREARQACVSGSSRLCGLGGR